MTAYDLLLAEGVALRELLKAKRKHPPGHVYQTPGGAWRKYPEDGGPPIPWHAPGATPKRTREPPPPKLPRYGTSAWDVRDRRDWQAIATELMAWGRHDDAEKLRQSEREADGSERHHVRQRALNALHAARATKAGDHLALGHFAHHLHHWMRYLDTSDEGRQHAHQVAANAHYTAMQRVDKPDYPEVSAQARTATRSAQRAEEKHASSRREQEQRDAEQRQQAAVAAERDRRASRADEAGRELVRIYTDKLSGLKSDPHRFRNAVYDALHSDAEIMHGVARALLGEHGTSKEESARMLMEWAGVPGVRR